MNTTNTAENVLIAINTLAQLAQELSNKTSIKDEPKLIQSVESIHQPYIDRLINETAEWLRSNISKVDEKDITFYQIKGYQKYGQWEISRHGEKFGFALDEEPCLRIEQVRNRLWRIMRLKNVEDIEREFKNEICRAIGLTESEICMQQHMIARYFNVDLKYNYFTIFKALDMDREQMKTTTNLVFDLEKRYGIYDTDRKYGQKIEETVHDVIGSNPFGSIPSNKKIHNYTDKEWYEWFEQMIEEHEKLCYTDRDTVIEMIFNAFKRKTGFVATGSLAIDIHKILSDKNGKKTLKDKFSQFLSHSFIGVW